MESNLLLLIYYSEELLHLHAQLCVVILRNVVSIFLINLSMKLQLDEVQMDLDIEVIQDELILLENRLVYLYSYIKRVCVYFFNYIFIGFTNNYLILCFETNASYIFYYMLVSIKNFKYSLNRFRTN